MNLSTGNQRWLRGLAAYRPPDEPIRTIEYDIAPLPNETAARAFVLAHHYSGTYPAARWRFGLFHRGTLQGVAVFSHPCNDRVLTSIFPGQATDSVELGRFVLLDEVPGNGETWMLGRCFHSLRCAGCRYRRLLARPLRPPLRLGGFRLRSSPRHSDYGRRPGLRSRSLWIARLARSMIDSSKAAHAKPAQQQ